MPAALDLEEKLGILNEIAGSLNRAVDVRGVLDRALADLVRLMGLETGWITLKKPLDGENGYLLAAHHNLPPALSPDNDRAWGGRCTCQKLCDAGELTEAYNEVRCSRLEQAGGDRRGLSVHASAPLRSGDQVLGILNVAAPDWDSFSPEALGLLTNVGSHIGVALERARLYDLLQQRHVREQAALLNFSNQLLRRLGLDDLMDYLVEEVRQVLNVDACALLLPNDEPGFLEFQAVSGWCQNPAGREYLVPADDSSGPGQVMGSRQALLVDDLQEHDPTLWAPDWLQAEGFRVHAIVPLLVEGEAIGVLVVNQRQKRPLAQADVDYLQLMANQAAVAIEKVRLHQEEIKMQALGKELEVGKEIQLSLLPGAPPTVPGWQFAIYYQAARVVGGDFYDFMDLPGSPRRLGLVVADVAGKGIPAALSMARGCTVLRAIAQSGIDPGAVLSQTSTLISQDGRYEEFITAFYAVLEIDSGLLRYARAGHNPPLWFQAATGEMQELASWGLPLGITAEGTLEEQEIQMAPGDLLVLYSDGVTEAMDGDHALFEEQRLRETVSAHNGASAQEVVEAIVEAVHRFTNGADPSDDLTLVVVRRNPSEA
jgi:sigma-B regulation protein RsbU (phosphoserine phosphatase)